MCSLIRVGNDSDKATDKEYFDLLSRGGLTVPSRQMVEFVCACFAILENVDQFKVEIIINPQQECLQNKFWKYILQNIVLLVKNSLKNDLYL